MPADIRFTSSAEHHRMTRFRSNGVPLDRPGHYVYLRDDQTGEYWSVSWQPVGKDLTKPITSAATGFPIRSSPAITRIFDAEQTVFIPLEDDVELWDVRIRNTGTTRARAERFRLRGVLVPPYRDR